MTDTLQQIKDLGNEIANLTTQEESLLARIEAIKQQRRQITDEVLPTLMDEIGIEEILLDGGAKIKCYDFVVASIKDQETAYQWLRETNNDGIIKHEISIKLGKGSEETAARIKEDLVTRGAAFTDKESIHYSTLNAFVKEALLNPELESTMPKEALGVYESRRVVFK